MADRDGYPVDPAVGQQQHQALNTWYRRNSAQAGGGNPHIVGHFLLVPVNHLGNERILNPLWAKMCVTPSPRY